MAFAKKNPLVPLARWNDCMDVVERIGVTDRRVLSAVMLRGINYCQITEGAVGVDAPGVADAISASLRRMDPDLVLDDARISPAVRGRFAASVGLPECRVDMLAYLAHPPTRSLSHTDKRSRLCVAHRARSPGTQPGGLEQVGRFCEAYTKESGAMVSDPTHLRMSEASHACA